MSASAAPDVPYGRIDRLLHRLAFRAPGLQRALADIEDRLYRERIDLATARRPVFVTSLPRAGTTVLLEALAGVPELGAATYRQMPFTLLPLLWSETTRGLRAGATRAERAHGDGVEVGFDSPEAFEETAWMAFWPDHYRDGAILPWPADATNPDFEAFLPRHMAKVVAAAKPGARRYLSKNNANIARLGLVERLFPDATILVPVRHPAAQAASLLRQHRRFGELHARDPFARTYMEGLGHFEFGAAFRPIAFAGGATSAPSLDDVSFWLGYWCDAFASVLTTAGSRVVFVDADALAAEPAAHLPLVAEAVGLKEPGALTAFASRFRAPPPPPGIDAPPALLDRAAAIHDALTARCLRPHPPVRARAL